MLDWFKKKSKKDISLPDLLDLDGNPLREGDTVESLRYDLGICQILLNDTDFIYESLASGEKVSWIKMIDASTERQKVRLVKGVH